MLSCHVYEPQAAAAEHAAAQPATAAKEPPYCTTPLTLPPGVKPGTSETTETPENGPERPPGGPGRTNVHESPEIGAPPETTGASPGKAEIVRPESWGPSASVVPRKKGPESRSTSCCDPPPAPRVATRPRAIVWNGAACVPGFASEPLTAST